MKHATKWIKGTSLTQPISEAAQRVLAVRLQDVCYFLSLAAKKPKNNIKYVHQLRIATRRANVALRMFENVLPKCRVHRVKKQLRCVRRGAGDVRDLDVLLQRLRSDSESSYNGLRRTIKQAAARRKDVQKPLVKAHKRLKREHFKREIKGLLRRTRWRCEGDEPDFSQAARCAMRLVMDDFFAAAAAASERSDIDALHQMRIRGKQLRYAMELFAGAFDKSLRDDLYPLFVEVQDRLGEVIDHATAERIFRRWAKQSLSRRRRKAFRKFQTAEAEQTKLSCKQFHQWWTSQRATELNQRFAEFLREPSAE